MMGEEGDRIRNVLAGDVDGFEAIVKTYEQQVKGVVYSILRDVAATEDVAQEAFVSAYRKLGGFDAEKGSFRTWLLAIARHRALNVRAKKRPIPVEAPEPDGAEDGSVEHREVFRLLDGALREVDEERRRVFEMVVFEGLDYQTVAELEGVAVGTVRSRVARVRERLREVRATYSL